MWRSLFKNTFKNDTTRSEQNVNPVQLHSLDANLQFVRTNRLQHVQQSDAGHAHASVQRSASAASLGAKSVS